LLRLRSYRPEIEERRKTGSLIEGNTSKAKVLSYRNRREKEDRKGESQTFRERTLSVRNKIRPEQESKKC
jgi:hypothetical protein